MDVNSFEENYVPLKFVITLFYRPFDTVFINPAFSPTLIIGRLLVRNQVPEYARASQKKFAWIIGVTLSGTMCVFLLL